MSDLTRTTVYLETADYRRLKSIAEREGRSAAELVREAVSEYAGKASPDRELPRSIAAGESGRSDLSERSEEFLRGMGEDG